MNEIYIFLDYSNTTNDILSDGKLNQILFDDFFDSLCRLENKSNSKARLIIATGNNEISATKLLNALKFGFSEKDRLDILCGIAYEYGGYFLSTEHTSTQICRVENIENDIKNAMLLADEYGYAYAEGYKTVLSFDNENPTEKYMEFLEKVKNAVKNSKIVEFNDKYGCGIDILPKELSKANFVENFLKDKSFSFIVVGGDGEEDVNMLNTSYKNKTYFVGFKNALISGKNIFLSSKENISGITEAINTLAQTL